MQNKPNLCRFSPKNELFAKKQSQTNPIQTQFMVSRVEPFILGLPKEQTQPVAGKPGLSPLLKIPSVVIRERLFIITGSIAAMNDNIKNLCELCVLYG
jgi:hypothetical protein